MRRFDFRLLAQTAINRSLRLFVPLFVHKMTLTVQQYLDEVVARVPGLFGIAVTDKDGALLVKSFESNVTTQSRRQQQQQQQNDYQQHDYQQQQDEHQQQHHLDQNDPNAELHSPYQQQQQQDQLNESPNSSQPRLQLQHSLSSSFAQTVIEQANKLSLGNTDHVLTLYNNGLALLQANLHPLVMTLFATVDDNNDSCAASLSHDEDDLALNRAAVNAVPLPDDLSPVKRSLSPGEELLSIDDSTAALLDAQQSPITPNQSLQKQAENSNCDLTLLVALLPELRRKLELMKLAQLLSSTG